MNPITENGKTRQKCVENLSRLDELQIKYDDPVSHFKKIAEERTFEKKAAQKISVPIDMEAEMDINEDNLKNCRLFCFKRTLQTAGTG